jgi:hypothetical protein
MTSFRRLAAGALAVVLVSLTLSAMLVLGGCRKQEEVFIDTNLAPDTHLTSAPATEEQANYRIHLFWDGTDPDGYVVGYYFAWDDTIASSWEYTGKTDSLFKAKIDTAGETRRHTFYVRAVDNEGKLDATPARIRFDAWTALPVVSFLYRTGGPMDPDPEVNPSGVNPTAKDTVLMGTPCEFLWDGWDPDGQGAPIDFSFRLDSSPFSPYGGVTQTIVPNISSGTHFFYVKGKDETGAESFPKNYKFVMNFDPDSKIIDPTEPTGTLTIADRDTIWFRWVAVDKEELEGLPDGGIKEVWIELDTGFQKRFSLVGPDSLNYAEEFYFTSNTFSADEHFVSSTNLPTGGNKPHVFRVYARDLQNRFEFPSARPEDLERYSFWYNHPPTTEILSPTEGATVPTDFVVSWLGTDVDGSVEAYQYVLDPQVSSWRVTDQTSVSYEGINPGQHEFRVRARDNADCWETGYRVITFHVE